MTWWHGSGRIVGDLILPPSRTGVCRSGDDALQDVVFVARSRGLALSYASSTDNPWLYEVEPIGPLQQDPGSTLAAGESMMCVGARIVRRFKPSRAEVAAMRSVHRLTGILP